MKPQRNKLTPQSSYWETYIAFHTGQFSGAKRDEAKAFLYYVHYGNWDTSEAAAEVDRIKKGV